MKCKWTLNIRENNYKKKQRDIKRQNEYERNLMDFLQLAENRYSVRKFTERSVEREIIDKILRAGMLAPTAKNLQPQRILVLTSKESLEKLDRATKCRFGAPAAMLVCYDRDACGSGIAMTGSRAARWTPPLLQRT